MFLHDNDHDNDNADAKVIAITRVFSENSRANNTRGPLTLECSPETDFLCKEYK